MDEIKELEAKLELAKHRKKIETLMEQIKIYKDKYLDKCFSTKALSKKSGRVDAYVMHVYDVIPNIYECTCHNKNLEDIDLDKINFDENDIALKVESIEYVYDPKIPKINLSYTRTHVAGKRFNIPRYEISLERFNEIVKTIQCRAADGGVGLLKGIDSWDLFGDEGESLKASELEKLGYKFVELDNMELVRELSFHPFLYGKHLMLSEHSYDIIKNRLKHIIEKLNLWYGTDYSDNIIRLYTDKKELLEKTLKLIEKRD